MTQPFTVSGYALDLAAGSLGPNIPGDYGTGFDGVVVYAYQDLGSGTPPITVGFATYGMTRPDVAALFGARYLNSGYSIDVTGLPGGQTCRLAAYGRTRLACIFGCLPKDQRQFFLRTVDVTIP